ncbi:MAG TPA: SDR family oxidoreductase [Streptosporangiaceae bacterium]|nr:SDR family oxidoreductase [Streptosporangiaceae bacterium]
MKIVVIGGGPIGSKLVTKLREHGHGAVAAAPEDGVDILTGEGLACALAQATVVIDVSNPPSFEDAAVLEFFETATRNLLAAEAAAGVGHHVALSAVGIERLQDSVYFRAKSAQEKLIENSAIPYSIVRATQFFEFLPTVADAATDGSIVRCAPVLFQPVAEDDAVQAVGKISVGPPLNGTAEVAGPERFRMDEFFRTALAARDDPRTVVTDPQASFFGTELGEQTLLPDADVVLGETRYRNRPGRTPAGGTAFLHELERSVRSELILIETSQPEEEAVRVPIEEWLSDPADDQRYEASLRSLLGAVEAVENGSCPEPEGR